MKSPEISPTGKDTIPNQYIKPPAMLPAIKDPTTNQDGNRIINKQDTIIPPLLKIILLDINHYLMIHSIQIKQKTTLMILQIIHVLILMII